MSNSASEQVIDQSIEKGLLRFVTRRKGELLLRAVPGDDAAMLQWAWWVRQPGQPDQGGYGDVPEAIRTLPATLILRADEYTLFDVPAPPGLKESEYPLLLEDMIMGDLSAQQVRCVGRLHGRLQLIVCACERLEAWHQRAQQSGLKLNAIVTDFQRLADAETGVLLWRQQASLTLLKPSLPDQMGGILGWSDTALPPLPKHWQPEATLNAGDVLAELAQLADLARSNETSLLPRSRVSRIGHERAGGYSGLFTRLSPLVSSLKVPLVGFVLSLSCFGLAAASQNWSSQSSYRAAVTERLGLPAEASKNRVRRELRLRLNLKSESLLRLDNASKLYQQLDTWLQQTPGWQLLGLEMQAQTPRIVLRWQGEGEAMLPDRESASSTWVSLASLKWQRLEGAAKPVYELTFDSRENQQ